MSASEIRWCLVVATIGRTAEVGALLGSLAAQTGCGAIRIVLVDQNADHRLEAVLAPWRERLRIEQVRVPANGVSQARNLGLERLGDATHVAFPDDDCTYLPDTLAVAEAAFAKDPRNDVLIGAIHAPGEALAEMAGIPLRPCASRIGLLRGAGMPAQFYRRSALVGGRRFDPAFGPGGGTPWLCGEDSDFLIAAAAQHRAARCPRIRLLHPRVDRAGTPPAKARGYGRGRIRLLRKWRFPSWFILASIMHPLLLCVVPGSSPRFRWHLFRGRWSEWLTPHRPQP